MAAIRTRSLPLPEAVPVVAAAAFSISVGVAVLIGWIFQLPTLRSVLPGLVPMQLNTAAAFIMLGVALAVIHARTATAWQLRLAQASALGVIFLAAWSLGQYVIVRTVGIGGGLIKETMPNPTGELGHMSPLTAVSFASLATATLLLRTTHYLQRWIVQCCVILPLLISTRALIGYVYRAHTLYFVGESMPLALHTTTTFIVLCLGLLGSRTDLELTALVRRRSAGGVAARRLLPAVLCAPLLLGMAILHGESIGLYGRDTSLTLFTISMCGLLMWLVWWAAHSIDDVDEQRQIAQRAERESRILSDFDPLTGLLNRRSFLTRCEQERLRAQREERPMSCIMLDIDYFKKINDTHGHSVGDMVLRTLAAIFCDECRSEDLVCRYGGEEFCVLLPDTNEANAVAAAQRIRLRIVGTDIPIPHQQLRVSGSFGVAELSESAMSAQMLIDRADEALLVAKQTGRDRVVSASSLSDTQLADERPFTRPLAGLLARDIMVPVATTLRGADTVRRAASCLLQLGLESAPVIDSQGKLAGLVTDQDVMAAMIIPEASLQPVSQIMHRTVVCFEETATAEEIFRFLCRVAIPRVVVIQEGRPVGVLSRTIILRWLHNVITASEVSAPSVPPELPAQNGATEMELVIETLTRSAWRLACLEKQSQDDLSACVIGEASRLQETVEHLLSLCQQAHADRIQPNGTVAGARSFI